MTEEIKLPYKEKSRLAKESGYGQQFISKIFQGKRRPSWHNPKFKKLCAASGIAPELWMDGTVEEIIAGILAANRR